MDLAARATAVSSKKGTADGQKDSGSSQPIAGNRLRETARKQNSEANVKDVPTHVLMLINRTRHTPENAGTPNRSGSCPRLLMRSLNPGQSKTIINGTTTKNCHALTPGFLAPRVDTAGVSIKTADRSWSKELTAEDTVKKRPDIATDTSSDKAAATAHRHECLTVNPANKGFMRASTSSTAKDAIRESKATTNIIGHWFCAKTEWNTGHE